MTPLETIESVYTAFERGDVESIVNRVAPGASWRQPETVPWGGKYVGPDGARNFFAKLNAAYETTMFWVGENIVAGERVISLGRYEGNSRKTGKHAGGNFCFVWTVHDGKVTDYEGYLDTAAYAASIG
jgi:uncharacterized protein